MGEIKKKKKMVSISIAVLLFSMVCMGSMLNHSSGGIEAEDQKAVGECLHLEETSQEEEMKTAPEMRRALWAAASNNNGKRYISYDALKGDSVPCNRPGIPYYNCHALPKANPYSRGCSVITACARSGD